MLPEIKGGGPYVDNNPITQVRLGVISIVLEECLFFPTGVAGGQTRGARKPPLSSLLRSLCGPHKEDSPEGLQSLVVADLCVVTGGQEVIEHQASQGFLGQLAKGCVEDHEL